MHACMCLRHPSPDNDATRGRGCPRNETYTAVSLRSRTSQRWPVERPGLSGNSFQSRPGSQPCMRDSGMVLRRGSAGGAPEMSAAL